MYTIKTTVTNELIINKSRFITQLYPLNNLEDISKYLAEAQKQYPNATHYCYAYLLDNLKKESDDKEPSGTAGLPILNVLEKKNLNFILCIVIRYFGGIKLGSGGLIRAYSNSCIEALKKACILKLEQGYKMAITFTYDNIKKIAFLLKSENVIFKEYNNDITFVFETRDKNIKDNLRPYVKSLTELGTVLIRN